VPVPSPAPDPAGWEGGVNARARTDTTGHAATMNKTEAAYASRLEMLRLGGEIARWDFEPCKLRLAGGTFYSPDFRVILPDGLVEFHEVKGFWRDDARVKIKVAAEQHPYRFVAVQKRRKKDGGGWKVEVFG
jgi:hypothetical protein